MDNPFGPDVKYTQFCSCGCNTPIGTEDGFTVPSAKLADNYVFKCGELNYIEVSLRQHVLGRTLRNGAGQLYVVSQEVR